VSEKLIDCLVYMGWYGNVEVIGRPWGPFLGLYKEMVRFNF